MLRDYFTPEGGTVADLTNLQMFVSGAIGGLFYWIPIYPTDVIKSALQSDESEKGQRRFKGIVDCAKTLYREEVGWRRFYRGFTPCILRATPFSAIMLFTLEKCRLFLG